MTAIIVDTSAVLASLDEAYAEHEAIAAVLAATDGLLVVSPMVAAESDYMLYSRLGAAAARQFAADVAAEAYELPEWTATDHAVALNVINRNSDDSNYIGITDAATWCWPIVIAQHGCSPSTSGTSGGSGRCGERTISRCCPTTCEEARRSSTDRRRGSHATDTGLEAQTSQICTRPARATEHLRITHRRQCAGT